MDFKTLMSTLFGFSAPTFYSWKKEGRPIIKLLEKYFTREELEEFLENGKIKKFEQVNRFNNFLFIYRNLYFKFIQDDFGQINNMHNHILIYYFEYLFYLKNNISEFENNQKPFYAAAVSFGLQYNLK